MKSTHNNLTNHHTCCANFLLAPHNTKPLVSLNFNLHYFELLERNWDDNIRHYIKEKRIEEILEPILISLLISGLENHSARDFVLEKLTHIQNVGLDAVTWKTFIPGNYKKTKNDRNCLNTFLVILSPSCARKTVYSRQIL